MFYASRFYILRSFLPIVDFTIDCNQNVSFIFTHLMSNYEATTEMINCNCGYKKEDKKCVLHLPNTRIVWQSQFQTLEEELKNIYEGRKSVYCQMCHQSCASVKYLLGPYLYIDTDDAYASSGYAKDLKIDIQNLTTNLNNIPTKITIILGGVIRYIPPMGNSQIGHYVAYCYTAQKRWIEKNDLLKNSVVLSDKQLPSFKVSAILYVKR